MDRWKEPWGEKGTLDQGWQGHIPPSSSSPFFLFIYKDPFSWANALQVFDRPRQQVTNSPSIAPYKNCFLRNSFCRDIPFNGSSLFLQTGKIREKGAGASMAAKQTNFGRFVIIKRYV